MITLRIPVSFHNRVHIAKHSFKRTYHFSTIIERETKNERAHQKRKHGGQRSFLCLFFKTHE